MSNTPPTRSRARRLLVIGRSGQLARALAASRASLTCLGRPDLDLTDQAGVGELVARLRPDGVINAAAHVGVDKAETEPGAAFALNCDGP
jgi:dTDP-4-dehydrorhamnose reductase